MNTVPAQFERNIQQRNLFRPAHHLLVGVSGGLDSMALLHLLQSWRNQWGVELTVAHFNHNWRASSVTDQEFVRAYCDEHRLPFRTDTSTMDVARFVKGSLEEYARHERYNFFRGVAVEIGAYAVVTAHHLNDQAETVLLRLLRGSGLSGLRAMNDVRELDGLKVIRPLLNVPREQLEDYARQEKVPYREDPTNTDEDFLRNRIRQELLPLLKRSYNPNIEEVLANTAVTISGDYRFLEYAATKEFRRLLKELNPECKVTLDLPGLMALDVAMKRFVIRISVESLIGHSRSMSLSHVQEIEDLLLNRRTGSEVHLPHGVKVTKGADILEFGY